MQRGKLLLDRFEKVVIHFLIDVGARYKNSWFFLPSIGVEGLFLVKIGEDVEIRKIFKFLFFCNFFNL